MVQTESVPVGRTLSRLLRGERTKRKCADCGAEFEAVWAKICNDCAVKRENDIADREAQIKVAAEEYRYKEIIRLSGIPNLWKDTRFESSDITVHPDLFTRAREYAEAFSINSPSLIFFGENVGTGKTHLAMMIANHALHEKKIPVLYLKARDLLINLRGLYSSTAETTEKAYLDMVTRVPLLILDDVGRDRYTDWVDGTYWTVFDRRLENGKPTIITTNRVPAGIGDNSLESRIGYAGLSRLLRMCDGLVFEVGGSDLR